MYSLKQFVLVVACLCFIWMNTVDAAPHKAVVLSPSSDDFYKPPSGFENKKPGAILRSRSLPADSLAAFSALPQNLQSVYQILYRTTNAQGEPDATVTTLMVPHNANSSRLVSYQVMIDSPSVDCAPSHVLRKGDGLKGLITQAELLFMDALLERGWYVNTADYEGSKAAFAAGAMAGQALLDSIRAVLASGDQTKIKSNADVQLWGYSGGALASGWAVQLQPTYAPDLKIIGTAMGGTPVNLNATLNLVNKTPLAGFVMSGINGLANSNSELATYIDSIIKPEKKKAFYKAKDLCLSGLLLNYAFQDMGSYVTRPDYTNAPIAKKVLEQNIMGRTTTPKVPLFMYHAKFDQAVPYAPAADLYSRWCKGGATIQFVKDDLSEHVVLFITGAANAIIYLEDRFKGIAPHAGCSSRTTITSILDPGALAVFGKTIWAALNGLLGLPLGPGHL